MNGVHSEMMFAICPEDYSVECDSEWYEDIDDAKENALSWSVNLSGSNVIVYEVIEKKYENKFKPIRIIFA